MHSTNRHVEYRGEIVELTELLLRLPAGGQILLSDTTFQRIGGRLHEVKLPAFQLQRPSEGPRNSMEGQSRRNLEGQSRLRLYGQSKAPEGQRSAAGSRQNSSDSPVNLLVCLHATQATLVYGTPLPYGLVFTLVFTV